MTDPATSAPAGPATAAHAASPSVADALGQWAERLSPTAEDEQIATLALRDTIAVARAAREQEVVQLAGHLGAAGRLAVAAHALDYDDLHVPSTSHVSAVCVPAALAAGGDARAYLAAAGVMVRLGTQLGWSHYHSGWHTTCTAGAPAAAVAAGVAMGLHAGQLATAIALAIPAAGGNERAFGTHAKALQVGFAVDAGVRAASLAAAGAGADLQTVERWLELTGAEQRAPALGGDAIPGGLAMKLWPCCYALQRPIQAARQALAGTMLAAEQIEAIRVTAPSAALRPLIHHRPRTGLQAKFSLEYGLAATVLDGAPGLRSFGDEAVARAGARELLERVEVCEQAGGGGLLSDEVAVALVLRSGEVLRAAIETPDGAPGRPAGAVELARKLQECGGESASALASLGWETAARELPGLLHELG